MIGTLDLWYEKFDVIVEFSIVNVFLFTGGQVIDGPQRTASSVAQTTMGGADSSVGAQK